MRDRALDFLEKGAVARHAPGCGPPRWPRDPAPGAGLPVLRADPLKAHRRTTVLFSRMPFRPGPLVLPLLAAALCACGGGGGGGGGGASAGPFRLESINVSNGAVWPLNERMVFTFNRPVDASSVSFGSIVIQGQNGVPVTGTFFVDPCSGGRGLVFQPTCPTDAALTTGGLQPNAITYTLSVVTGVGPTVLRSTDGAPLAAGASVTFRTPLPPFEPP